MRLGRLRVENYRALRDVTIPLSNFSCLVGRNNSGKSSILQAVLLLRNGNPLRLSDFHDAAAPVRIELTFHDVDEGDLSHVKDDQQRARFREMLIEGDLTLVRLYDTSGKSALKYRKMVPKNENLNDDILITAMKEATGSGREAVVALVPALDALLSNRPSQKEVKEQLGVLRSELSVEELRPSDEPLSTGLDKSILPLLPEVVYIPAVKDVADEIKTSGTAAFGKLIGILFEEIQDELDGIDDQFKIMQRKLSRVIDGGREVDERLPQVQHIERTLERYVRQNFPDVRLQLSVPAPELRSVLNGAELTVDDGTSGPILAKGDGLKRAVVFAVLQAWAELRATGLREGSAGQSERQAAPRQRYILLFEEPELFLHPAAQHQLFKALSVFAAEHEVVVTTHSPAFIDAGQTKLFVKVSKAARSAAEAPATTCRAVALSDMRKKDQLQLIGYENNNAALFADVVVLVEGDCDFLVLPALALTLLAEWDDHTHSVVFVRVSGKASFARYKKFFSDFGVTTHIACDLDALTADFNKLDPNEESRHARDALIARLQQLALVAQGLPGSQSLKSVRDSRGVQALWADALNEHRAWQQDTSRWPDLAAAVEVFFERASAPEHYRLLVESDDAEVHALKRKALECLSRQNVHVLSRGCLEDYYPEHIGGSDKVEKALAYMEWAAHNIDDVSIPQRHGCRPPREEMTSMFSAMRPRSVGPVDVRDVPQETAAEPAATTGEGVVITLPQTDEQPASMSPTAP